MVKIKFWQYMWLHVLPFWRRSSTYLLLSLYFSFSIFFFIFLLPKGLIKAPGFGTGHASDNDSSRQCYKWTLRKSTNLHRIWHLHPRRRLESRTCQSIFLLYIPQEVHLLSNLESVRQILCLNKNGLFANISAFTSFKTSVFIPQKYLHFATNIFAQLLYNYYINIFAKPVYN